MPRRKGRPVRSAPNLALSLAAELSEAALLVRRKRWTEARDVLERLARRHPQQADVLAALVNVYYELRDIRGYQRACERLIKLTPDEPDLVLGLAGAYLTNLRPALALRTFRRFLERWPDHARAAEARATVANLEASQRTLLAELGLAGEDALDLAALHEQAQSLLDQGEYRQARAVSDELLRRRPDFVPALNNLSQMHAVEGRLDQAIAVAQRALVCDPDNVHALSNLTRYLCLSGRLAEARQLSERLKAVQSDHVDVWVKRAEALSYLGDDQGVLDSFDGAERAGALRPPLGNPLLYHLAAVAALRLGQEDRSRRWWRQALRAAPGLDPARDNLADLRRPAGERHGPWPFTFANWISPQAVAALADQAGAATRAGEEGAVARAVRRYLRQRPEVVALIPLWLDRGDPQAREFALRTGLMARTPELLAALRDFALSPRGPDVMRQQALEAAIDAGLVPQGPVRLWLQGEWREILAFNVEIHGEPTIRHPPPVDRLNTQAMAAMRAGAAGQAERLLRQALELEPDAPDLWQNLAAAYDLQGRAQESEAIVRRVHDRHPDYLFARVSLARQCVQQGQVEEAKALLQPLLSRRRMHRSEFAAFCDAQIELYQVDGKPEAARSWLELWGRVDPDDPRLDEWRRRLRPGRRR